MTLWRLIAKEIGYRRLSFALSVLAVLVAVGCLVAELTLLRAHDVRAERIGESQEARTRGMVGKLEEDYTKITLGLGYNVLVLAKEQDLSRFYAQGVAETTMPEAYVKRLSESRAITVQHLMPTLQERIEWPEKQKFPILLMGTRGEVPIAHRDVKKPLLQPVKEGTLVLGSLVGERLGLKKGDAATLRGKEFTVAEVRPPRGNEDDVTVWADLGEAQALLGKPGQVSAILALSCFCAEATLDGMRREIGTALDQKVQVLELAPQAATRRAARARASALAEEAVQAEEAGRAELRTERQGYADWIVPLVIAGCTVWVGLMAFSNVRDRRGEIGVLRALGVRGGQVLAVFLGRALLVGLAGAALGYALGLGVAAAWDARQGGGVGLAALAGPWVLAGTLVLAPLFSAIASFVPAVVAAGQDPAEILVDN
jgi:hypothetical protein